MRYFVSLSKDGPPLEVDVKELPSGALDVRVAGRRVDVDMAVLNDALSIRVDGRVIDLTTEGAPPELGVIASGHRSYVRVESERQRAATAAQAGSTGGGDEIVRSPMPGRVVRVLVALGDEVKQGQALVVVEAMKMENELRSKRDGKVAEVHVAAGAAVEGGAKLLKIA